MFIKLLWHIKIIMYITIILFLLILFISVRPVGILQDKVNVMSYSNTMHLRGILTIVIILHHLVVCQGLLMHDGKSLFILPHMGYLCVSSFLFLSGYALLLRREKLPKNPIYYWKKILFLFSVFLLINFIFLLYYELQGISLMVDFKKGLYNGSPIAGQSWYLVDLIVLYIVFIVSGYFKSFSLLVVFALISCVNIIYYILGYPMIWMGSNYSFGVGMLYYIISNFSISKYRIVLLISFTVLFLFVLFISLRLGSGGNTIVKVLLMNLCGITFSLITIVLLSVVQFKTNIWSFIGKHSLEIFLWHVLIYKILRGGGIYVHNDTIYCLLTIVVTIVLAIPLSYVHKSIRIVIDN